MMTPEIAAKLRAPFPEQQVGWLPKPYSKDSKKSKCPECGKVHGMPAAHLRYVGHAAVTDRLLQVDPMWTWEPVSTHPDGSPKFTDQGGLWIRLTVAGVTRLGYGDETLGKGTKEIIGDALRNAAMRFGVALDLWSKEDLHATDATEPAGDEEKQAAPPQPDPEKDRNYWNRRIHAQAAEVSVTHEEIREWIHRTFGVGSSKDLALQELREVYEALKAGKLKA